MAKNINEMLDRIITEAINEVLLGPNDSFTPYTKKEREQNFAGLTKMGNPGYDDFKRWRNAQIKKGRDKKELSWERYLKETGK